MLTTNGKKKLIPNKQTRQSTSGTVTMNYILRQSMMKENKRYDSDFLNCEIFPGQENPHCYVLIYRCYSKSISGFFFTSNFQEYSFILKLCHG